MNTAESIGTKIDENFESLFFVIKKFVPTEVVVAIFSDIRSPFNKRFLNVAPFNVLLYTPG